MTHTLLLALALLPQTATKCGYYTLYEDPVTDIYYTIPAGCVPEWGPYRAHNTAIYASKPPSLHHQLHALHHPVRRTINCHKRPKQCKGITR